MKKTLLLLVFTLILVTMGKSQISSFQAAYGTTNDEFVRSVARTSDGGFIIAGGIYGIGQGDADCYIVRTDSMGNFIWGNVYGDSLQNIPNKILVGVNGDFFVIGNARDVSNNPAAFIMKLDPQGNFIWLKYYAGTTQDVFADAKQTADGGFIISGSTLINSTTVSGALVKVDSLGNLQWTKALSYPGWITGFIAVDLESNGYIAAGNTNNLDSPVLMRVDLSGNLTWAKYYTPQLNGSYYCRDMVKSLEGGYLIAGNHTNTSAVNDYMILKTDNAGNVQWAKKYGTPTEDDQTYALIQIPDSTYALAGMHHAHSDSNTGFIRFDTNGDTILTRYYRTYPQQSDDNYAWDITTTHDGGFAMAGFAKNYIGTNDDVFLLKADIDGNSACNSRSMQGAIATTYTVTSTSAGTVASFSYNTNSPAYQTVTAGSDFFLCNYILQTEEAQKPAEWTAYPNPFSDKLEFNWPANVDFSKTVKISITNINGQLVREKQVSSATERQVHTADLCPGVYFCRIINGDNVYSIGKLIKIEQ